MDGIQHGTTAADAATAGPDNTQRESSEGTGSSDEIVIREFELDSDSLWQQQPIWAFATLGGPIIATIAIVIAVAIAGSPTMARHLILTALLTFFMLGRFVILGGRHVDSETAGLTPGQLALMVLYLDVMTAIVISWHAGVLFRIPWLGRRLRFLMKSGRAVLSENRWMRRTTFLAIVAFVMFPLASSGSVGGSLFGRLLGLSRGATFLGVVIGSLLGCGTMYYAATVINQHIDQQNPLIRWGGIAAIVILIAILNRRYRRAATTTAPPENGNPTLPVPK